MYNSDMEKIKAKYKGRLTRQKAIRLYCKEMCCAGDTLNWKNCLFSACFLYSFRLGRETLGNQTSFRKQRQNSPKLPKKTIIQPITEPKTIQEVLL